ncbi:MAG: hypothetical protein GY862_14070 [Gammaproteobacteria bacterium]|nr:hypothetical protein [Gammaproteobacteria bacterium]
MTNIKTTITTTLGEDTGLHLSAEVDSRADGPNAGKTSFKPGDTVYLLVYASESIQFDSSLGVRSSLEESGGTVSIGDRVTLDIEDEILSFDGISRTASLAKPIVPNGKLTTKWFGNSLGDLTVDDDGVTVSLPDPPPSSGSQQDDRVIKQNQRPGVCAVSYKTKAYEAQASTVTKERMGKDKVPYNLLIVIHGETKDT